MKRNTLISIFVVLCYLFITACSDMPGKQVLEQAIHQQLKAENVNGVFEIKNAEKENGFVLNDLYHAEISYERHCLVGIDEAVEIMQQQLAESRSESLTDSMMAGVYGLASRIGLSRLNLKEKYGEFSKGDVIKEKITIKFIKTEQGWRVYQPGS